MLRLLSDCNRNQSTSIIEQRLQQSESVAAELGEQFPYLLALLAVRIDPHRSFVEMSVHTTVNDLMIVYRI